jgi:hypothetical protein
MTAERSTADQHGDLYANILCTGISQTTNSDGEGSNAAILESGMSFTSLLDDIASSPKPLEDSDATVAATSSPLRARHTMDSNDMDHVDNENSDKNVSVDKSSASGDSDDEHSDENLLVAIPPFISRPHSTFDGSDSDDADDEASEDGKSDDGRSEDDFPDGIGYPEDDDQASSESIADDSDGGESDTTTPADSNSEANHSDADGSSIYPIHLASHNVGDLIQKRPFQNATWKN